MSAYWRGEQLVLEMMLTRREDLERIARIVLGSHYRAFRINEEYWEKLIPSGHRRRLRVTIETIQPPTPEELAAIEAEERREIDDP